MKNNKSKMGSSASIQEAMNNSEMEELKQVVENVFVCVYDVYKTKGAYDKYKIWLEERKSAKEVDDNNIVWEKMREKILSK